MLKKVDIGVNVSMAMTKQWYRNTCYFCGACTPPSLMRNYDVVACQSCCHQYKNVPRHIPVEQVKRYFTRVELGRWQKKALDKQIKFDTT